MNQRLKPGDRIKCHSNADMHMYERMLVKHGYKVQTDFRDYTVIILEDEHEQETDKKTL